MQVGILLMWNVNETDSVQPSGCNGLLVNINTPTTSKTVSYLTIVFHYQLPVGSKTLFSVRTKYLEICEN